MKLKLYIGAHKTATTHVQNLLSVHKERLLEHNVSLSVPVDIRPLWFPFLNKDEETNHNSSLIKKIISNSPKTDTWIFAEENICGVPYDLKTSPHIYPNLGRRLSVFKNLFPDADFEVFFSMRSYAPYYTSSYLEVIRNRGFFPFSDYYDEERFSKNSWYDVVQAIVNFVDNQNQIKLWLYEDFQQVLPQFLEKLTNLEKSHISEIISSYHVKKTRPSISKKTLSILESLHPMPTQQSSIKKLEDLNMQYPASSKNGYFSPFTKNEVIGFTLKYQKDIERIKHDFPAIDFIARH